MLFDGFDWDDGNWPKCAKHGVAREEIEAIFYEPSFRVFPDPAHSQAEQRWLGIGYASATGRWVFTVFAARLVSQATLVRPISARYMHEKEVKKYVRQTS